MKQAQGSKEKRLPESHRAWAWSQVLWLQYHHASRQLPLQALQDLCCSICWGFNEAYHIRLCLQKLLLGCGGSRVGKQGITQAWQEGFPRQPECWGAMAVPYVFSWLQGSQRSFSESVWQEHGWQGFLVVSVKKKDKWAQNLRCAVGVRSQSERLHTVIPAV